VREFIITPHDSIGPAKLGMSRSAIRQALGETSHVDAAQERWGISFPDKDYFLENAFQVSYDANLEAEFIEASSSPHYVVTFNGIDVHKSDPNVVIAELTKIAPPDTDHREYPCNQVFRDIDLTIYREHSEEDCIDAIGIGKPGYTHD
jgi:hypothetical protein